MHLHLSKTQTRQLRPASTGGGQVLQDNRAQLPLLPSPNTAVVQLAQGYAIVTSGATDDDPVTLYQADTGAATVDDADSEFFLGQGVETHEIENGRTQISAFDDEEETIVGWIDSANLSRQPAPTEDHNWGLARGKLWGGRKSRKPAMNDVHQGDLGDCFFLAPLAALAGTPKGKLLIKKMIKQVAGQRYQVAFHNIEDDNRVTRDTESETVDRWFPVTDEFDSSQEKFKYAQANQLIRDINVPLWVAILEKAFAQWDPDGYEGLDEENASRAIAHLTGVEPQSIRWDSESQQIMENTAGDLWQKDTYAAEEAEDESDGDYKDLNVHDADLLDALIQARKNPNNAVVAESLTETGDDSDYLDRDLQILDTHVYVVKRVTQQGIYLWDTKSGALENPVPIADFKKLFNRVLLVNAAASTRIRRTPLPARRVGGMRVKGIRRRR